MVKKTRKCKACGTDLEIDIGIHNWKNLFRKPTLDEYIMLFIILLSVFSYFQYNKDINTLREYYEGGDYCSNVLASKQNEIRNNEIDPLNSIRSIELYKSLNIISDEKG